jgi:hypothetical protein
MELISPDEARAKNLKRYFTGKPCKHGHVSERSIYNGGCIACNLELSKQLNKKNPSKRKEAAKRYIEQNKEKIAAYSKEYRKNDLVKQREKNTQQKHRRLNPDYHTLRSLIHGSLHRLKIARTPDLCEKLGYTLNEFRIHIEKQFKSGMTWENHGEWHVDHKKPIAVFIKEGILDLKRINALNNLQPLWALENIKKQAKWSSEDE